MPKAANLPNPTACPICGRKPDIQSKLLSPSNWFCSASCKHGHLSKYPMIHEARIGRTEAESTKKAINAWNGTVSVTCFNNRMVAVNV